MRSRIGSSASTVLMLLPLVIVPALAMFGVADPRKLDASADAADQAFDEIGNVDLGVGQSAYHDAADLLADSVPRDDFARLDATAAGEPSATRPSRPKAPGWSDPFAADNGSWTPPEQAVSGWTLQNARSVEDDVTRQFDNVEPHRPRPRLGSSPSGPNTAPQNAALPTAPDHIPLDGLRPDPPQTDPSAERRSTPSLSWQDAIARLHELGIHHYQLEPGSIPSEFHFSCSLTPADNPRVTHRFEAQADDPLHAVSDVLAQIEDWQSRR